MTELSAAAKAILDAGQTGLSPSAATKASVLQGVETNLAGTPASAAAASSATTGVLSLKLVLTVVVAVGIGGGFWFSRTGSAPATASTETKVLAIATPVNVVPVEKPDTTDTEAAVGVAQTTISSEPLPIAQSTPPQETTLAPQNTASEETVAKASDQSSTTEADNKNENGRLRSAPKQAQAAPLKSPKTRVAHVTSVKSTLADEQKLIAAAQVAIRRADYSTALTLLESHSSDFPKGILAPERDAATAIAQCMSGKGGKAAGRRFLDKHSQSPLAARVRTSCELP